MAHYDFKNPIYQVDEKDEEDCELSEELARLLRHVDKVIQVHQETLEVTKLGTEEVRKEVNIGDALE